MNINKGLNEFLRRCLHKNRQFLDGSLRGSVHLFSRLQFIGRILSIGFSEIGLLGISPVSACAAYNAFLAGRREPAEGTVKRGKTVVVGFADQHSADLDPDAVVRKLVAGPHREPDFRDRALLERFWFDTTAQYAPVRMLSGGERRRLQLVMVLATEPNLLILDEPTNDLDLDTLRALESFLDDWPGALVVASHDRAFLDRVADHVLAIDPGGSVRRVPGGVAGWLAERSQPVRRPMPTPSKDPAPARTVKSSTGPTPSTIGRRLRETEQAMVKAQTRVDRLTGRLAEVTDHTVLRDLGAELAVAQAELDALESRWLELAELQSS